MSFVTEQVATVEGRNIVEEDTIAITKQAAAKEDVTATTEEDVENSSKNRIGNIGMGSMKRIKKKPN